jgi:hypothetical protein
MYDKSPSETVAKKRINKPIKEAFFLPILDIVIACIGVNTTPENSKALKTNATIAVLI